jgi:hypothetical protein
MFKKLRRSRAALVGVCCALVGAAVVPVVGWAGITGPTGDGPMVVQSGESDLSMEIAAGISSLPSTYHAMWTRVGDTVTMSGGFTATQATVGARAAAFVNLPVDSNINSPGYECSGTVTANGGGPYVPGGVWGAGTTSAHTHQCQIEWFAQSTGGTNVHFNVTYRVRS